LRNKGLLAFLLIFREAYVIDVNDGYVQSLTSSSRFPIFGALSFL